jgi:hypothetical protein
VPDSRWQQLTLTPFVWYRSRLANFAVVKQPRPGRIRIKSCAGPISTAALCVLYYALLYNLNQAIKGAPSSAFIRRSIVSHCGDFFFFFFSIQQAGPRRA